MFECGGASFSDYLCGRGFEIEKSAFVFECETRCDAVCCKISCRKYCRQREDRKQETRMKKSARRYAVPSPTAPCVTEVRMFTPFSEGARKEKTERMNMIMRTGSEVRIFPAKARKDEGLSSF